MCLKYAPRPARPAVPRGDLSRPAKPDRLRYAPRPARPAVPLGDPSRPAGRGQGRLAFHRQCGSSLIEVLVAILVVAVGVLALAGLLASAARLGKTAEFRAVAALLVSDIGDRMRANLAGQSSYAVQPGRLANQAVPPAEPCRDPQSCSAEEIAAIDLADWQRSVFNGLPQGTAYLNVVDPVQRTVDIWIAWQEPAALSGPGYDNPHAGNNHQGAERSACPPGFSDVGAPRCQYARVGL